jgi:transposase
MVPDKRRGAAGSIKTFLQINVSSCPCDRVSWQYVIATPTMSGPQRSEAEEIIRLKKELEWAHLKIRVLEERLRLQRIDKYGPKSEKLSDAQLELLEAEPGVSRAEVEAESAREPLPSAQPARSAQDDGGRRRHPGRQTLPPHLPRVERIITCTAEQGTCANCGKATSVIGYEESEQLDVEPARYFVAVTRREKRACRDCAQGVSTAAVPERIVEKGLVSDAVVIDTLVSKYGDHLPLYRQSAILSRETGIDISRATMDGWVMRSGDLLMPAARAIGRELLDGGYIQADETPVPVQMHDGRGKNHQGYLWQYSRPGGSAVFDFRTGRGREGPKTFLGNYEGILQTDGYSAYDRTGGPKMVHAACWAHARRKLFEAVKLSPEDKIATQLVARMDDLFAVDAEARKSGMDPTARHALRQERSRPLLGILRAELEAAARSALPSSALGKAVNYTLTLWQKLTRFLDYPEIELSSNLAENSMRPVVLGRKNWIHVGSENAAPKVAAILSVFESCRRLNIPVRDYLADVLPRLAGTSIQRMGEYTPAAWAAARR